MGAEKEISTAQNKTNPGIAVRDPEFLKANRI